MAQNLHIGGWSTNRAHGWPAATVDKVLGSNFKGSSTDLVEETRAASTLQTTEMK